MDAINPKGSDVLHRSATVAGNIGKTPPTPTEQILQRQIQQQPPISNTDTDSSRQPHMASLCASPLGTLPVIYTRSISVPPTSNPTAHHRSRSAACLDSSQSTLLTKPSLASYSVSPTRLPLAITHPTTKWNRIEESSGIDLEAASLAHQGSMELLEFGRHRRFLIDLTALPKFVIKRQEVIHELISTESDYLRDLRVLIEVFMNNMRSMSILPKEGLETIFSNTEQLIQLHQADKLKIYCVFCTNHSVASEYLINQKNQGDLKIFLQYCSLRPECRGMDLSSFLLKPIQRICKYPLLLREIKKHTPDTHADSCGIDDAILKITGVVDYVNEKRRRAEQDQQLEITLGQLEFSDVWMLPTLPERVVICESILTKVSDKSIKMIAAQRMCVLFRDCFVIAKLSLFSGGKAQVSSIHSIWTVTVSDIPDTDRSKHVIMVIINDKKRQRYMASSAKEKTMWINGFILALRDSSKHITSSQISSSNTVSKFSAIKKSSHSRVSSECAYPSVDESIEEHQSSYTNGDDDATNYSDACFPHSMGKNPSLIPKVSSQNAIDLLSSDKKWGISQNVTGSCPARPNMQPLELGLDSQGSNSGLGISHESLSLQHYQSLDTIAGSDSARSSKTENLMNKALSTMTIIPAVHSGEGLGRPDTVTQDLLKKRDESDGQSYSVAHFPRLSNSDISCMVSTQDFGVVSNAALVLSPRSIRHQRCISKSSSIEDIPKLTEGGLGLDTCSRMGDHSSANEKYTLISARSSGQHNNKDTERINMVCSESSRDLVTEGVKGSPDISNRIASLTKSTSSISGK
ncbi:hypothetical protein BASA50_007969 [Batrachochytrium salamandrivorans]|uniref:DH domain-containing protein n=1 Tax=Batrachochytrium salamandrivorans TaxID=1357716 RepID=A0ABQ8F5G5_9FUNG|nr:hypothetical protein BASA50_007969 [Batrachochytrium salamandrivorans]